MKLKLFTLAAAAAMVAACTANASDRYTVTAKVPENFDGLMAYLVDLFPELASFRQLSIGMSGDWKIALQHGATIVRIGTAIFGKRDYGTR